MTTTNTYTDTKAVDYLEAIKRNQLESRNAGSTFSNFDMTYSLPMLSAMSMVNALTNTEQTLGDYDIVDNTAYLLAYFPFDYDVNDAMNSNDGTVTGTTTYIDFSPEISSTHPVRKAFSFNGSSYITLANESNFDFDYTNTFSVAFWVKMGSISADQGLVMKTNNLTTGIGWGVYFNNSGDTISFKLADGTTAYTVTSSTAFTTSKYNHIVVTYAGTSNRSGMKIYVNGTLETTGTSSAISGTLLNNSSVILGAESDAGSIFTGSMSEVQIWNKELSTSQITDLYAGKQIYHQYDYGNLLTEASDDITTEASVIIETEQGIINSAILGFSDIT